MVLLWNRVPEVPDRMPRRDFLRRSAVLAAFVAGIGGIEALRKGWDLYEQDKTWIDASRPNAHFLSRHAKDIQRLTLGGSFAPEEWTLDGPGQSAAQKALDIAVRELGIRQLRLAIRWNRAGNSDAIDLAPYRATLDYCLANEVDVCLNVGPIRVFRWPEEHVSREVLANTILPASRATVRPDDLLARRAFDYFDGLLDALRREYGASKGLRLVQIENEPFYPLGQHEWVMSQDYLSLLAQRVHAALPEVGLLVTSAGRLDLNNVRDLFARLLQEDPSWSGRLVSGFDFHYRTPLRDSFPIIRHFDQITYARPFAPRPAEHVWAARDLGFGIEVSEGQAEPYDYFTEPGNSARDFRFLILRCLDKVLDPAKPALIRIWGVEHLTKRMLNGDLDEKHREIIEVIQTVNGVGAGLAQRTTA
jgi:hypothetical protein